MNTERIRELAEQAGISLSQKDYSYYWVESAEDIEKFAALVAAEEREACAKVCESLEIPDTIEGSHPDYVDGKRMAVMQCAAAIRARGNDAVDIK
jgi:hypothetical protein